MIRQISFNEKTTFPLLEEPWQTWVEKKHHRSCLGSCIEKGNSLQDQCFEGCVCCERLHPVQGENEPKQEVFLFPLLSTE